MKVVLSRAFEAQADQIFERIFRDKPSAAVRWWDSLRSKLRRLSRFPNSGRVFEEKGFPTIRQITFGNYLVLFEVGEGQVDVLAIFHGAQRFRPAILGLAGGEEE
jgi:toxin ParE1/3/4